MAYHGNGWCSNLPDVADQRLGAHRRLAGGAEFGVRARSAQALATVTRMGRDRLRARVAVGD